MPDTINVGGSYFKAKTVSGKLTASIDNTTPLTITPSAGSQISLTNLTSTGGSFDITINIGGVNVVSGVTLSTDQTTAVGSFNLSSVGGAAALGNYAGTISSLIGGTGEAVIISTSSGALVNINYSFIEGSF